MSAFELILWVAGVMLAASAVLVMWRLTVGPAALDRIVATDVLVAVVIGAVAIVAVLGRSDTGLPVVLALSLVGFSGAVALARLISGNRLAGRRYRKRLADRAEEETP